jgi:uncharacterized protein YjbI with pentapeptide repeats
VGASKNGQLEKVSKMPAPLEAYTTVAEVVGGLSKPDRSDVDSFFEDQFPRLHEDLRSAITEWIISCNSAPDKSTVEELQKIVLSSHVKQLKEGVTRWNTWRKDQTLATVNLNGADLNNANLSRADLTSAILRHADLTCANLSHADLTNAILRHADLTSADLSHADLTSADLSRAALSSADLTSADLSHADLSRADLTGANLNGANLTKAQLFETVFADVDFTNVIGLETCRHNGPSIVDHRTLEKCDLLPLTFLRGVGLPDTLINNLPSLLRRVAERYSCFVSYSAEDADFARRIHADLQNEGVHCWFEPHDMPIGNRIQGEIDTTVRLPDKFVLILSMHSVSSRWVQVEVTRAVEEEQRRGRVVLFPVLLDDAVMNAREHWASELRGRSNVADFRRWKDSQKYAANFQSVLQQLKRSDSSQM